MESGAIKGTSVPRSTFIWLLGFASPVAILEMVLFFDKPKEIGKPVSLVIRLRISEAMR